MTDLAQMSTRDAGRSLRGRIFAVCGLLLAVNLLAWVWALVAFAGHPVLIGTAFLAYSLGLRHALDADHIAAIDNVTRKLMQEGKRPVAVGLFFALGHSSVVVSASVAVALAAHAASERFSAIREYGGIVGTSASALFLFVIAVANLLVLRGVYGAFRQVKNGQDLRDEEIDTLLAQRGGLARLFGPLFSLVAKSWHLYPIGLLFALGFETASEISLFGLSAEASKGLSGWSILIFPALFAAAMTLVDTADGIVMLGAYGWAYVRPMRKLFYNLTITSLSAAVAIAVGGIEALGLMAGHFGLTGAFWDTIAALNANFGALGYVIVGLFVVSWGGSILIYRLKGYDRYERRSAAPTLLVAAIAIVVAGLACRGAVAADAAPSMPRKAPVAVPPYDWNGFYFGGHVGYGVGHADAIVQDPGATSVANRFDGLTGGVQFGYNVVLPSRILLGLETDLTFPSYFESNSIVAQVPTARSNVTEQLDYAGTVRGRIGYVSDPWMIYATGGFAFAGTRVLNQPPTSDQEKTLNVRPGWSLGAGAEYALSPHWSARLEFLYSQYGSADVQFPSGTHYASTMNFEELRVGLNRKLGAAKSADEDAKIGTESDRWELHAQTTYIQQGYPSFRSPYQGPNSLSPFAQTRETWTMSAYVGMRLWDGGELYYNPELLQGFGLSDTVGVAGFPNGEAQKSNFPYPRYSTSRLFLRQTFGFGGEQETLDSAPNQLSDKVDVSRLTLQVGRFAVTDVFDGNAYAKDTRKDFMNWSLWAPGAFDYSADRIGLSYGATGELNQKDWALRAGYFLMDAQSDSNNFDTRLLQRGEYVLELEERYKLFGRAGKLRIIPWLNSDFSGSYRETLDNPALDLDIAQTRKGRIKYGYVLNLEQSVSDDIGLFGRWSWNDGHNEIMAFTDIDRSLAGGVSIKGTGWGRADDTIGIGGAVNGLSQDHRDFIAAGGLGPLIGDGRLNYRTERILESYYSWALFKSTSLTFDYQLVVNPAFNADRGPVSVFAGRLHADF